MARRGLLRTAHGEVPTPIFMPVATQGAVKGLWPAQLREAGARIVLANAYHLALRPGDEVVERLGGLHRLMAWDGPILTDSGGFQVFSLQAIRRVDEEGVLFRSHIDGAAFHLTPERSMEIQRRLGSDIVMAFDECPALPCDDGRMRESLERTGRWLSRCAACPLKPGQLLFGIVQGGVDADLRRRSLDLTLSAGLPGLAIGGLSVGESREERLAVLRALAPGLPAGRPRYLMGVGTPLDILEAVELGVDMFDCVMPTRDGRHGVAYTDAGRVRLRAAAHRESEEPLDPACPCACCRSYSRGHLRHFLMAGELLGSAAVSLHNVHYYLGLMERARRAIGEGRLAALVAALRGAYLAAGDSASAD